MPLLIAGSFSDFFLYLSLYSTIIGLFISLVELVAVELIPDFEGLVDVWIALFGRSESFSVGGICAQSWQSDWNHGIARRAIFDVARSRFPNHVSSHSSSPPSHDGRRVSQHRRHLYAEYVHEDDIPEAQYLCDRFVYHYLFKLILKLYPAVHVLVLTLYTRESPTDMPILPPS